MRPRDKIFTLICHISVQELALYFHDLLVSSQCYYVGYLGGIQRVRNISNKQ